MSSYGPAFRARGHSGIGSRDTSNLDRRPLAEEYEWTLSTSRTLGIDPFLTENPASNGILPLRPDRTPVGAHAPVQGLGGANELHSVSRLVTWVDATANREQRIQTQTAKVSTYS